MDFLLIVLSITTGLCGFWLGFKLYYLCYNIFYKDKTLYDGIEYLPKIATITISSSSTGQIFLGIATTKNDYALNIVDKHDPSTLPQNMFHVRHDYVNGMEEIKNIIRAILDKKSLSFAKINTTITPEIVLWGKTPTSPQYQISFLKHYILVSAYDKEGYRRNLVVNDIEELMELFNTLDLSYEDEENRVGFTKTI